EDELIKKQGNNQSPESLKYGEFCNLNCLLIQSYIFLNNIDQNLIPEEKNKDEESVNELLQINENQIIEYFELKKKLFSSKKVKFRQTEIFNLPKFLSCFDPTPIELSQSDQFKITFEFNKAISDDDKEQLGSLIFSNLLKKYTRFKNEDLDEFFKMVPIQKIRLLDLLIHAMLNEGFTSIHAFYDLVFILSGCLNIEKSESSNTSDPVDHDFESIFINGFLPKFKNTIENSKYLINSLIVVWVIRSILIKSQIDNSQIDIMNTLIDRISSLIKLNLMFSCGSHSVLHSIDFDFNIRNILNRGRGIFSELTSKHVVLNGYPPKLMNLFDVEIDESNSPNEEQKMLQNHDFKLFYDALQDGRKFLPKSLESDTLLVNCAWESILMYEKEVDKGISYLDLALKFCSEIGNAILRQGILSIIWHKDLSKKIASLTKLIDKTGNLPNDKIVRSEVGIKEEHTVTFLTQIMNLLDLLMDANCNLNEVPIFNYDRFWKDIADYSELGFIPTNMILNLASGSSSPTDTQGKIKNSSNKQLVELAAEQKPVNYHLCLFQYQLIRILYLIGKLALFSELHTHPLISNDVDAKIVNTRKLFFTKALNSIMKQVKNPTNIRLKLPEDVNESLTTVFNLSKDMEVDSEFIKRYYCCLLYALDYHFEAEKILHGIKEVELFASQLLIVVGHKVNDILENNTNPNLIAILSTNLKSWLKSLGPPDYRIHTISSKQAFLELIGIVLHRLPESFSEYKIATEFLDFLENPLFKL
ncbi:rab3 GTPase-activating non-catalytic subunit-like, partial [Brachionus plicatilis]